jgi:hypothetical protein
LIKVIFLLKRLPGVTHEQFREHYESSHVKMAQKYFGHLMISYERNYPSYVRSRGEGEWTEPWEYDCITEWRMPTREDFDQISTIMADPDVGKEFHDDEARFLDMGAVVAIVCEDGDVVNTGTGGGHGWLSRLAQRSPETA